MWYKNLAKWQFRNFIVENQVVMNKNMPLDQEIIADKQKWGGNMTIIEYEADTVKKSIGAHTSEKRLYVTSLPAETPFMGSVIRNYWSIESMLRGCTSIYCRTR